MKADFIHNGCFKVCYGGDQRCARQIKLRRGTLEQWQKSGIILLNQEIGFVIDKGWLVVGDGDNVFDELKKYRLIEVAEFEQRRQHDRFWYGRID